MLKATIKHSINAQPPQQNTAHISLKRMFMALFGRGMHRGMDRKHWDEEEEHDVQKGSLPEPDLLQLYGMHFNY